jgi:hypothetical protein
MISGSIVKGGNEVVEMKCHNTLLDSPETGSKGAPLTHIVPLTLGYIDDHPHHVIGWIISARCSVQWARVVYI